jgi:hypothetical protein
MANLKQDAQSRTWKMPLATSNTNNPLAIALTLYPVLEVRPSLLLILALNNWKTDACFVPSALRLSQLDASVSNTAWPYPDA